MARYDDPGEAYEEAQRRIQEALADGRFELDLRWWGLTAVPPEIAQLTRLQELDLSNDWLTAVPEWLVQLPRLERLTIYQT